MKRTVLPILGAAWMGEKVRLGFSRYWGKKKSFYDRKIVFFNIMDAHTVLN